MKEPAILAGTRNFGYHPKRERLKNRKPSTYAIGSMLYCRGIAAIHLIAIVSWWVQSDLLIGESGLVPAQDLLDFLDRRWENGNAEGSRWNLPTLFWLTGASDPAIHILCGAGCLFAILAVVGIAQGPALSLQWIIYLSLVTTGDVFMSFQWDILLLESGVLAILLSSWRWREKWREPPPLNLRRWIALALCWLVVAKLMFLSGWVKLAWASESQPEWWPDHTAMTFHYETQPIPTWTAWMMHQLPVWFHKLSIWPMYFIELILPFFVFFGSRLRAVAGLGFSLLMLLILLTGNYTYFNWLTIVLSVPLIADRFFPKKVLCLRSVDCIDSPNPRPWVKWSLFAPAAVALFFLLLLNIHVILRDFHNAPKPLLKKDLSPEWLDKLAGKAAPFYLSSGYGLFRTMTIDRPEIVLEGSGDGLEWKSYDFKWKPDLLDERPRFVAPHQPRVAWQLWFAALERKFHNQSRNSRWIQSMLLQLLKGEESVKRLFREDPFPDDPPRFLRARLYLFEFTTPAERKKTGNWWKRTYAGEYLPEIRLQ